MMDESADEIGDRIPLICGVYADGSHIAADIAHMADAHGASALLCFPPSSLGMGGIQRRPEMGIAHMKMIADATDLRNARSEPLLAACCSCGAASAGCPGMR